LFEINHLQKLFTKWTYFISLYLCGHQHIFTGIAYGMSLHANYNRQMLIFIIVLFADGALWAIDGIVEFLLSFWFNL